MSRSKIKLTQDGKYIRRLLMVGKILWGEYCRLWKEVKQLVIEKKLNIWNELVEKVNTDFDENRKEFWAFVGRKSKGKKKNIVSYVFTVARKTILYIIIMILFAENASFRSYGVICLPRMPH